MLTKEQIIRTLEANKDTLKSFGVIRIELFGSYARDEQTKKSDIDFLVEFAKGRGLFRDTVNLLHFLRDLFKKEVDIVEPELIREELRSSILGGERIAAQL